MKWVLSSRPFGECRSAQPNPTCWSLKIVNLIENFVIVDLVALMVRLGHTVSSGFHQPVFLVRFSFKLVLVTVVDLRIVKAV
jgi:hypothetical protein